MIRYLLGFSLLFFTLLSFSQTEDSITVKKHYTFSTAPAYVTLENDTLFEIVTGIGAFDPDDRARTISRKLGNLAAGLLRVEDSFQIVVLKDYSVIRYKDVVLMSVSEEDAAAAETSRAELAALRLDALERAIIKEVEGRTIIDWVKQIGFTLLTLAGLVLIFFLLNRFFKWINKRLSDYEKSLKRKRTNIFRYLAPKGPESFFIFLSNVVRFILIILILFLYLPLLFSFLPWTEGIVQKFYQYISDPVMYVVNGLINFLPDLFFILVIIFIARYIVRILTYMAGEIEKENLVLKGFHKDWAHPTLNIVRVIIYVFALVFIFPYLPGSDSPAFQGVSIFLGVLLSLGSTSAIANIVAGIVITYMRPFMIGDRVKIGETVGDVVEKTLLVTRIKTLKNEDVTIPNATIINNHLWNFTKNASEYGIILHPKVTIGYNVPSETVIKLLLLAAKNTPNLTRDFKPFVLQKSLNDYNVEYELNVYTKQPDKMMFFYSELNQSIQREFNKAGIEILSPRYSAVRDGNHSTIPGKEDTRNPVEKAIDKVSGKDQAIKTKPGKKGQGGKSSQ